MIEAVQPLPVKVIIEIMVLTQEEIRAACEICVRSGAAFVKTGTGWADRGTTAEDVRLVKSYVGERVKIKASGGIRNLSGACGDVRRGGKSLRRKSQEWDRDRGRGFATRIGDRAVGIPREEAAVAL